MLTTLRFGAFALMVAVIGASSASAQGYLDFLKPVSEWKDFEFGLNGGSDFSRDDKDTDRDYAATDYGLSFGSTLFADKEFGLKMNAGYHATDIDAPGLGLPDELVSAELGFSTSFKLSKTTRFLGALTANSSTDNEDVEGEDIDINLIAGVMVPVSKDWTLIPGLYFSSRTIDGRTPAIPFPLFEAMYRPSKDFTLLLGLPATGAFWKANDWLTLSGFTMLLSSWNMNVSEKVSDEVSFSQFYSYGGSTYRLTDENFFPDDFTINKRSHELGAGMTWAPSYKRESGKKTTFTLRLEYAAQFGTKWEIRDDELDLVGSPVRLEPGNSFRIKLGLSF